MNAVKTATPQIDTGWFKERIIAAKKSQRKIAAALGIDPAALSLALRGLRKFTMPESEQLAVELGVPLDEVLEQMGINPHAGEKHRVNVVGIVTADGEIHMKRPAEGTRHVTAPEGMPSTAAAVRYTTEGFLDGALGYFIPATSVTMDATGRMCVAQVAGKVTWHLRVVRRGYGKGLYNLDDPFGRVGTIEGVKLASAAPAVCSRRRG